MARLYNLPIEPIAQAVAEGFTPHENFRVNDLSTYPEVIWAGYQYRIDSGTLCDYPCWIPEAGMVRINPDIMLETYNSAMIALDQ